MTNFQSHPGMIPHPLLRLLFLVPILITHTPLLQTCGPDQTEKAISVSLFTGLTKIGFSKVFFLISTFVPIVILLKILVNGSSRSFWPTTSLYVLDLFSNFFYFLHCAVSLFLQRADAAALSHDHGPDITAAANLSALHSFLCFDHELDNTVNAGVDSPAFADIFQKASSLVYTIRNSPNLYRTLRDDNVDIVMFLCLHESLCASCFLYLFLFRYSLIAGSENLFL